MTSNKFDYSDTVTLWSSLSMSCKAEESRISQMQGWEPTSQGGTAQLGADRAGTRAAGCCWPEIYFPPDFLTQIIALSIPHRYYGFQNLREIAAHSIQTEAFFSAAPEAHIHLRACCQTSCCCQYKSTPNRTCPATDPRREDY